MEGLKSILLEDGIKGYGDVNPLRISREVGGDNLMMTLATRIPFRS